MTNKDGLNAIRHFFPATLQVMKKHEAVNYKTKYRIQER